MLTVQELLAKADECERTARTLTDTTAASALLEVAQNLKKLAYRLKELESDPIHRSLLGPKD